MNYLLTLKMELLLLVISALSLLLTFGLFYQVYQSEQKRILTKYKERYLLLVEYQGRCSLRIYNGGDYIELVDIPTPVRKLPFIHGDIPVPRGYYFPHENKPIHSFVQIEVVKTSCYGRVLVGHSVGGGYRYLLLDGASSDRMFKTTQKIATWRYFEERYQNPRLMNFHLI